MIKNDKNTYNGNYEVNFRFTLNLKAGRESILNDLQSVQEALINAVNNSIPNSHHVNKDIGVGDVCRLNITDMDNFVDIVDIDYSVHPEADMDDSFWDMCPDDDDDDDCCCCCGNVNNADDEEIEVKLANYDDIIKLLKALRDNTDKDKSDK